MTKKKEGEGREIREAAYAVIDGDPSSKVFTVGCCVKGEKGYHPVTDYGPYTDKEKAQGVVDRLNARLGIAPETARLIVLSTMLASRKKT